MTVKELRQGLRTQNFVFTLILLQIAMVCVSLLGLVTRRGQGTESPVFWVVFTVCFLIVQPLRGLNAVSGEMRSGSLDNLLLTGMSNTRIVFGKWIAIYFQTLLLGVTLLPFVVVRYFVGGVNLLLEFWIWFVILGTSGVLTAVTVGMSVRQHLLFRVVLVVCVLGGLYQCEDQPWGIVRMALKAPIGGDEIALERIWIFVGYTLVTYGVTILTMLMVGAGQLLAVSENSAVRRRVLAVCVVGLTGLANLLEYWFSQLDQLVEVFGQIMAVVLIILAVDALSEAPPRTVGVFMQRGRMKRWLNGVFLPGWQSGTLFVVLMFAGFYACILNASGLELNEVPFFVAVVGSLLFPAAVQRVFLSKAGDDFRVFVIIAVITAGVCGGIRAIDHNLDTELLIWLHPIPLAHVFMRAKDYDIAVAHTFIVCVYWAVILYVRGAPVRREVRALKREADTLLRH